MASVVGSAPLALAQGAVFARDFTVLAPLAQGGMGAVYRVEQRSTGKERALKVMLPELVADPQSRARFEQEARIGARVDSDHVVEVVSAGIDEATGAPWLAMELLRGETLADALQRRGPLPAHEARALFGQLAHALGAAHRSGVVHRDLKPENLFLAASRRAGEPFVLKVLDFGIAKVLQSTRTAATTTSALGSPLWMAPEQANAGPVRAATDVWALGLLGFTVLTGQSYWRTPRREAGTIQALLVEILLEPLEPASARAAELGAAPALPPGFDAWFARCVARDPSARFADGAVAGAALDAVLAGHGASASAGWFVASAPGGNASGIAGAGAPGANTPVGSWAPQTPAGLGAYGAGSDALGVAATRAQQSALGYGPTPGPPHGAPPAPPAPRRNGALGWVLGGALLVPVVLVGALLALRASRSERRESEAQQRDDETARLAAEVARVLASASASPSSAPLASVVPSGVPSALASGVPSALASGVPSALASGVPSVVPSALMSGVPSALASGVPNATASDPRRAGPPGSPRRTTLAHAAPPPEASAAPPEAPAASATARAEPTLLPPVPFVNPARANAPTEGSASVEAALRAGTPEENQRVIDAISPPLERCWTAAQARVTGAVETEHVRLSLVVEPSGRAGEVSVRGPRDAELTRCIDASLRAVRYPEFSGRMRISTTLRLTPD